MNGIHATDVCVQFGSVTAVAHVSLHVEAGRLLAVTGPSGAGKSSLLGALAGVHSLIRGAIGTSGSPPSSWHLEAAVTRNVALVPQGNGLIQMLTAFENVLLPLTIHGTRRASSAASAALAAVGLQGSATQFVGELSGGQQQRLALARALAQQPDVILADEPTSELDADNRTLVIALLKAEARRGAAVIIATHDREAANACDAELRLDDGRPDMSPRSA